MNARSFLKQVVVFFPLAVYLLVAVLSREDVFNYGARHVEWPQNMRITNTQTGETCTQSSSGMSYAVSGRPRLFLDLLAGVYLVCMLIPFVNRFARKQAKALWLETWLSGFDRLFGEEPYRPEGFQVDGLRVAAATLVISSPLLLLIGLWAAGAYVESDLFRNTVGVLSVVWLFAVAVALPSIGRTVNRIIGLTRQAKSIELTHV